VASSDGIVEKEVARVRELSTLMARSNQRTMKGIRDELDKARDEARVTFGASRAEAEQHVQKLARLLKNEEERQAEIQTAIEKQIAEARQAAASAVEAAESRLTDVKTEVGSVKREVAETQTSLTRAVSDLHRVVGDLGVMSGRIATNQRELELLRSLGDRRYIDFRLSRSKEARIMQGVTLSLKRADPRARTFTLELIADDMHVEKRDRTVNEPVQFYLGNHRQPYEIVVNTIGKNEISGYLSLPKAESMERKN
jgi:hypothetical protein